MRPIASRASPMGAPLMKACVIACALVAARATQPSPGPGDDSAPLPTTKQDVRGGPTPVPTPVPTPLRPTLPALPTSSPTALPTPARACADESSNCASQPTNKCAIQYCPTCSRSGECDLSCGYCARATPQPTPLLRSPRSSRPTSSPTALPTPAPTTTWPCADESSNCASQPANKCAHQYCPTCSRSGECDLSCGFCDGPKPAPSKFPTRMPTSKPSKPVPEPTAVPQPEPTTAPVPAPSSVPTRAPTAGPFPLPSGEPVPLPTVRPSSTSDSDDDDTEPQALTLGLAGGGALVGLALAAAFCMHYKSQHKTKTKTQGTGDSDAPETNNPMAVELSPAGTSAPALPAPLPAAATVQS